MLLLMVTAIIICLIVWWLIRVIDICMSFETMWVLVSMMYVDIEYQNILDK